MISFTKLKDILATSVEWEQQMNDLVNSYFNPNLG